MSYEPARMYVLVATTTATDGIFGAMNPREVQALSLLSEVQIPFLLHYVYRMVIANTKC